METSSIWKKDLFVPYTLSFIIVILRVLIWFINIMTILIVIMDCTGPFQFYWNPWIIRIVSVKFFHFASIHCAQHQYFLFILPYIAIYLVRVYHLCSADIRLSLYFSSRQYPRSQIQKSIRFWWDQVKCNRYQWKLNGVGCDKAWTIRLLYHLLWIASQSVLCR